MSKKEIRDLHQGLLNYYYQNNYLDAEMAGDVIKVIKYLFDDVVSYEERNNEL
jgi:hypothetical protein